MNDTRTPFDYLENKTGVEIIISLLNPLERCVLKNRMIFEYTLEETGKICSENVKNHYYPVQIKRIENKIWEKIIVYSKLEIIRDDLKSIISKLMLTDIQECVIKYFIERKKYKEIAKLCMLKKNSLYPVDKVHEILNKILIELEKNDA